MRSVGFPCAKPSATWLVKGWSRLSGTGALLSRRFHRTRSCNCSRLVPCWKADRKSTRLNSSHSSISYAVFCLKKKKKKKKIDNKKKKKKKKKIIKIKIIK